MEENRGIDVLTRSEKRLLEQLHRQLERGEVTEDMVRGTWRRLQLAADARQFNAYAEHLQAQRAKRARRAAGRRRRALGQA